MFNVGIDLGAKFVKVVVMKDKEVIAKSIELVGFEQEEAAERAFEKAIATVKISKNELKNIVSTGIGRKFVGNATDSITEVRAATLGATFLFPNVRTVMDVGAEEGRGIKCTPDGKVIDFAVNEKCAAGAGAFTEAMSRALEIPIEQMGPLSLKSTKSIPMNAQCAVFAESEVVSLIHAKTAKEDIAKAIHDAIASRITSMVRRVGVEEDIVLVGGLAKNVGFVDSLKRDLGMRVIVPNDPDFVSALGAATLPMRT